MNPELNSNLSPASPSMPESDPQRHETEETISKVVHAGPAAIEQRLTALSREWTTGRLVKVTTAIGLLVGLALAGFVNIWWLALPVAMGLLLIQYAFSRVSLLSYLYRSLGFRSSLEIEHERLALKALRGDFRHIPTVMDHEDQDALARLEGEGGMASEPVAAENHAADNQAAVSHVLERLKE
jgi:hypothetical protein